MNTRSKFLNVKKDYCFSVLNNAFNKPINQEDYLEAAFNDTLLVGMVSSIGKKTKIESIDDFESAYYKSGDKLVEVLHQYGQEVEDLVKKPEIILKNKSVVKELSKKHKINNLQELLRGHGRTKEFTEKLSEFFVKVAKREIEGYNENPRKANLSTPNEEDLIFMFKSFLLYNSSDGAICENLLIKNVDKLPGLHARHANESEDGGFAIDIVINNEFAIQLKPISYIKVRAIAHQEQKILNNQKNERCNMPYGYVYYKMNGDVVDFIFDKKTKEYLINKTGIVPKVKETIY